MDVSEGAFETFDVRVQLPDMILERLNPSFVLLDSLAQLVFPCVDEPGEIVGEPLVFFIPHVRERVANDTDDGWGKGSGMKGRSEGFASRRVL